MKVHYLNALRLPIVGTVFTFLLIAASAKLYPIMVVNGDVLGGYAFLAVAFSFVGGWAGYEVVRSGGNFIDLIVASLIVSAVVAVLQIVQGVFVNFPVSVSLSVELPIVSYNVTNAFGGVLIGGGFFLRD